MSNKPTIVFDLDGTLADTSLDLIPAINNAIALEGLEPVTTQQIGHASALGAKAMINLAYTLNGKTIEDQTMEKLFSFFLKDYGQNIAVHTVLYDGVVDSLHRFTSNGWILAVCTNKPIGLATKLLKLLGIYDEFSSVTGGDSFEFKKPDPEHLFRTIELAGGRRDKAVMVGDTVIDILTAQNAKIPVVAVDFGYCEHPVETYSPDKVISHYDELYEIATRLNQ